MYFRATTQICGHLDNDLIISKTELGKEYGVISITIEQEPLILLKTHNLIRKTNWFPIFIWSQELINLVGPALKKGEQILVNGHLGTLPDPYSNIEVVRFDKDIVVNVASDNGIAVITPEMLAEAEKHKRRLIWEK